MSRPFKFRRLWEQTQKRGAPNREPPANTATNRET